MFPLMDSIAVAYVFQAIARAYRYGQKKTCLVFKLMVKDSAEGECIF